MIPKLAQIDVSLPVKQDVIGVAELAWSRAFLSPGCNRADLAAANVEDLNPVIAGVGDPDLIFVVDIHLLRPEELAGFAAMSSPLHDVLALGSEFLYPV